MTIADFGLSIVASVIATAITGAVAIKFDWLGIRKDRSMRLNASKDSARGCLLLWREGFYKHMPHKDVCLRHTESIPHIQPFIHTVLGISETPKLKKAWDEYRRLKPQDMRGEDFPHQNINTDITPIDRSSESGYYAVTRALDALYDTLS